MEPKDIENPQAELDFRHQLKAEKEVIKFSSNLPVISSKFLRAGTVLVPKPEWIEYYKQANMWEYVVTEADEKQNATIGDNWRMK